MHMFSALAKNISLDKLASLKPVSSTEEALWPTHIRVQTGIKKKG